MIDEARRTRAAIPRLSKSRFLSGLQCHKRLHLECYASDLIPATDPFTQSVFDTGTAVGALARERFPGGLLVDEDHLHHDEAGERTRRALADPTVPAIYEGAFTWNDVRIRADVLVRVADNVFDLVEVKSTTRPRQEHEWDLAVQLAVLEGSGVRVRRAELMHLDRTYVYPGRSLRSHAALRAGGLDGSRTRAAGRGARQPRSHARHSPQRRAAADRRGTALRNSIHVPVLRPLPRRAAGRPASSAPEGRSQASREARRRRNRRLRRHPARLSRALAAPTPRARGHPNGRAILRSGDS